MCKNESVLDGAHILLRPITPEDTARIVKWRNLPSVRENLYGQDLLTEERHLHWLHTQVMTGRCAQFIIVEKHGETPVGTAFIKNIDLHSRKGEYGIFIGEEEARGKGYGAEAARLVLAYGFEQLALNRICLSVFAGNQAAIASYRKA